MAPRWLGRGGRVMPAPDPVVSPAPPAPGCGQHVVPWCACLPAGTEECPGSADDRFIDYYAGVIHTAVAVLAPPPLPVLADDVMLAVGSAPGKAPEQWRPAGPLFIGWPHAAGADLAVEMTAAQLRDHLTTMGAW